MKKNYLKSLFLFSLVLITVAGCKKGIVNDSSIESVDQQASNRTKNVRNITDPNDPNLNPNWQWWPYQAHNLYYSPTGSINNIQTINTFLPFYTQGNVLNSGPELDIFPEDGWVLAFRDFGTPTRPIDFPFFVLYNKYRAIFRVMLYNAQQVPSSYLKAELSFVNPGYTGGLMTFNAEGNASFLNSYDANVKDHQIATSNQFSDWLVFDYNLAGYDPGYAMNAGLKLQINRIDETTITLNSTDFTLNETVTQATPGGQGTSFATAINTGYNIVDGADKFRKVLKESQWGKSDKSIFHNILNSAYVDAIPLVGTALGIIKSFIGTKTKPAPRQPLKFTGTLNFSGLAVLGNTLYSRTFSLNSASTVLSDYKPVQPISWGLFNIVEMPTFNCSVKEGYNDNCEWYVNATAQLANPVNFISNHAANGLIFKGAYIGIIVSPGDQRPNYTTWYGATFPYHQETRQLVYGETIENMYSGREIGLKLYYEVINPTKYMDKDIVIYKTYPAAYNFTGSQRVDTCPNPPGGGISW
jgi:hypothetical protein